ncbi:MAG: DUF3150 domain-containing protein [Thiohalocapsa sp.]|nr:DUF3150 domain-containing protein [Thiohalocapsa sp.]
MSNDSNETPRTANVVRLTDRTTLFLVDYHIWSGRKKLRAEDLQMGTALPPDALISLGSKKICNPDALRVFHRNKKRVERELLAVGPRFPGGYIVPDERAAEVQAEADAIPPETRAAAEAFLADYDRHIDAWCAAYPAWEAAIRNAVDPVEAVRGQFRFRVQALRIETAPMIGADTLAEDLAEVGDGIFAGAGRLARGLEGAFLGKDALSRRALGTFRRIYEKLDALSFVDDRIDPVVRSIRAWLERVPKAGPIGGGLFLEGWALMRLVGDADAMARHGEGLLQLAELIPETGDGADQAASTESEESASETAADEPPGADVPEPVTAFDDLFADVATANRVAASASPEAEPEPERSPETNPGTTEPDAFSGTTPARPSTIPPPEPPEPPEPQEPPKPQEPVRPNQPEPATAQDFWF